MPEWLSEARELGMAWGEPAWREAWDSTVYCHGNKPGWGRQARGLDAGKHNLSGARFAHFCASAELAKGGSGNLRGDCGGARMDGEEGRCGKGNVAC